MRIRISGKGTFQNVSNAGAATSSPISTLMQTVSLKTQNTKVVEFCLGVPNLTNHLTRSVIKPLNKKDINHTDEANDKNPYQKGCESHDEDQ